MNYNKLTEKTATVSISNFFMLIRSKKKDLRLTDINSLLSDVLLSVVNIATMSDICVQKNLSKDIPTCMLNTEQVKQALLNILGNALQAMPKGGILTVKTSYFIQDEEVSISVSDTGEGIPPKNLDRVFNPFFSTRTEGLGLGLTFTNHVVKQLNGRVVLESIFGKGTTVILYFPAQPKLDMFPPGYSRVSIAALQKDGRTTIEKRVRSSSNLDMRLRGDKGRGEYACHYRNDYSIKC